MTYVNARSILVNLSLSKKKASNRPKTIGVLTRTKSSRSDLRIPLGYLLPDFQPHRSNFFAPPPPPDLTRRKGVDTKKKTRANRTLGAVKIICNHQATINKSILMFKKLMDLLSFRKAFSEVEGGVLTKLQTCVRYKVTHKALKQTVNKTRVSQ